MSQLQIGLISLGSLIILLVLLFNWWQERKIRREMYRRFEGPVDDALMEGLNIQTPQANAFGVDARSDLIVTDVELTSEQSSPLPELDTPPENRPLDAIESADVQLITETNELTDEENLALPNDEPIRRNDPELAIPTTTAMPAMVDPNIDEVAVLSFTKALTGAVIRDAMQPLPVFHKPVLWLGVDQQNQVSNLTIETDNVLCEKIICALQLADRSGPASGEDLRNFHLTIEGLASRISASVAWHEHNDPLQYAREIDQFCINVDVTISFHLVGGQVFAGTKLRGLAEASGLVLHDDGRFHAVNDSGQAQFMLAAADNRILTVDNLRTDMFQSLSLLMDVPRVSNGVEVLNQMVMVGRKLESALGARMVDENQQKLGDAEIEKIRQQLKVFYSTMISRGILPGSTTALRLFA